VTTSDKNFRQGHSEFGRPFFTGIALRPHRQASLNEGRKAASCNTPASGYTVILTMKTKKLFKEANKIAESFRITKGKNFRLKDYDPGNTSGLEGKDDAQRLLQGGTELLSQLQETLYAQDRWGLLLILQGMDAAGKDGVIKHVMSGVNPQGCDVWSFKRPSTEELDHDYLWRCHKVVPERGKIGIFNRSYYEEVLVLRVHPKVLQAEKLPEKLVGKDLWEERYEDINAFEKYLSCNGIVVLKFFLHLSKKEQKNRFLARLDDPKKNWKFSMDDIAERGFWKDYQAAYEELVQNTATKHAPWFVVPADNKWFTRVVVASAVVTALNEMDLAVPDVDKSKRKELEKVRKSLEHEND
jgi:PPK2 family polyphosphate:nucleotide phosphotransferase